MMNTLEKQGRAHKWCTPMDPRIWPSKSSYVRIRDVALKTCQRRCMIGRSGERGSGISVLAARYNDDDDDDDDDDDMYIYSKIEYNSKVITSHCPGDGLLKIKKRETFYFGKKCPLDTSFFLFVCFGGVSYFSIYLVSYSFSFPLLHIHIYIYIYIYMCVCVCVCVCVQTFFSNTSLFFQVLCENHQYS